MCKNENSIYLDFALQHKGKCLMELDRNFEAKECFKEALKIREQKEDSELIRSTILALDFLASL